MSADGSNLGAWDWAQEASLDEARRERAEEDYDDLPEDGGVRALRAQWHAELTRRTAWWGR